MTIRLPEFEQEIVISPQNPRDLQPHEELRDLAIGLQDAGYFVTWDLQYMHRGQYGVTYWEVLSLAIPTGIAGAQLILDAVQTWLKSRREKSQRPKVVIIYGPDGEELKRIEVQPSDSD